MAKADPRKLALAALTGATADPVPKPLLGTKTKPGLLIGSAQSTKDAAAMCVERGWVEPTGEFVGSGRSKKELHRITPDGIREALENGETAELLADMLTALDQKRDLLKLMRGEIDQLSNVIEKHRDVLDRLRERVVPPDLETILSRSAGRPATTSANTDGWTSKLVDYLQQHHKRNPYGHCPLPELYHNVGEPLGLTIGQFHDGVRQLVSERRVKLHPFTGAAYQLQEEQYALLAGQEIKYFAELS